MPTTKDLLDEVQQIALDMSARVDAADKEQKARGEDLTSRIGAMAAEYKASFDAQNARINELNDQIERERIAAARPPLGGSQRKNRGPQHDAFIKAMKAHGDLSRLSREERALIVPAFMPPEQKALYAGDATTGGFFASADFLDELIAYRLLVSPMRSICRIQPTSNERVQMPSLANDTTVYMASEQASFTDSSDPTVSMIDIPVHEMRGLLKVSHQNLEDSSFNLEDFIKGRLVKKFAQKEGQLFLTGTGAGQPRGLMNFPSKASSSYSGGSAGKNNVTDAIPYVASTGATGKITADDVLNVLMDLKADYRNMPSTAYVFTAATLNTIRLFKDAQQRPLWQPFGGNDLPSTIYGKRYVEMPDMAEIASGALPIAVGDFDNYMIVDRLTLNMQQLNELFAVSGLVAFIARLRVGGDVLLPEGFRTLKVN